MRSPLGLPAALLLLCMCVCAYAQTDIVTAADLDPTGQCVQKTSDICNGIGGLKAGSLIYVNSTHDEAALAAQATALSNQLAVLRSVYPECYSATLLFLCLGFFNPCEMVQVNATYMAPVPVSPCRNVCDTGFGLCKDIFTQFGQTYPPCPPTVVYDFSQSGGTANVTANCTSAVAETECIPIYELFFTSKEADNWFLGVRIFSWFGFLGNVILIGLYSFNPRLRLWPGPLVILMAVGQMVFAFALCMNSFAGRRQILCDDSVLGLCKVQGAFIFIGALYTIAVWLVMTVVTLVLVLSKNPKGIQRVLHERWYLFLIYLIIPTIFCILAFRDVGPNSLTFQCTAYDGDTLEQFCIWPVAGHIAIGSVAWLATVVVVLKLYLRLLVYELIALVPAILLVVPFESIRDRVKDRDSKIFSDGSARTVVESITVGAIISPIFFSSVFLFQRAHYDFIMNKLGYSSVRTTKSRSSEAEPQEEETSKF